MEDIIIYCLCGILCLGFITYLVVNILKLCKMIHTEKREFVLTYVKGLVAYAEKTLGSGKGAEKLKLVEDMFKKKAPMIYKMLLKAIGAKDITELIEVALAEVKRDFTKWGKIWLVVAVI